MSDGYEYFRNKRADRLYLSRALSQKQFVKTATGEIQEIQRPFRIVSKVIDSQESHQFIKDGKQVSLRITEGARQELIAKFYEDTRGIFTLQIQKYTVDSGVPHNTYFSFRNEEIGVLFNFLRNIELLPISDERNLKLDDKFVSNLVLTREQAHKLLEAEPELLDELVKAKVTAHDVAQLSHRKRQLTEFHRLLTDPVYFNEVRQESAGSEAVWQSFFERNTWIFGYGLNYVFNSGLDEAKLEQTIRGHDITGGGKRVDALLKTHGLISALSLGEIKTHTTELLKRTPTPYRRESWQVSDELAGGVAQVHRSIQASLSTIRTRLDLRSSTGDPTGETVFLYQPRSFLVIGSLAEFTTEHGINEEKYSSFELFRRNVTAPEIITFDELYERARFIAESEPTAQA